MSNVTVSAQKRDSKGTKAASDLRTAGLVPAVLYGKGVDTVKISVDGKELVKIISDSGVKAEVDIVIEGGKPQTARLQEVQRTKVTRELLHLDFQLV